MTETISLRFEFQGTCVGKMRNEIQVTAPDGTTVEMATDEGSFHGGDGTAPLPLAYFVTAVAGCLMTQVRAFAKRLDVHLDHLSIDGSVGWRLHTHGRAPYTSEPDDVVIHVSCTSPSSDDEIVALVEAASQGCFVEQSLRNVVPIRHEITHNGATVPGVTG